MSFLIKRHNFNTYELDNKISNYMQPVNQKITSSIAAVLIKKENNTELFARSFLSP